MKLAPKRVNSYYKIGSALNHIVQGRVVAVWGRYEFSTMVIK